MDIQAGKYKHFKGLEYRVIGCATNIETGEKTVIYKALYGRQVVYAKPVNLFVSEVDTDKYPTTKQKYKYKYIGESQHPRNEFFEFFEVAIHTETKEKLMIRDIDGFLYSHPYSFVCA